MNSLTFLHTSDFQLGMTRWFFDADAQARFEDARLEAIETLGQVAAANECEFIVVAGDVFDANSLEPRTINRALEALEKLPVPVYLLPGNHDPLVADSIFFKAQDRPNIHVLDSTSPRSVGDSAEIVGAPLLSKKAHRDLVAEALGPLEPTEKIRVMVGHGQVESYESGFEPDLIDLATVEAALDSGTIDYLALGDTHSARSLGTSGRVWFSGSPEPTDFHRLASDGGESNSGKTLVVSIDKDGPDNAQVRVDEHSIGRWLFHALDRELDTDESVTDFVEDLRAYDNKRRVAIKYYLSGALSLQASQRLELDLDKLRPSFAALYESNSSPGVSLQPGDDELANLELRGFTADALKDLIEQADDNPTARDAANLLFRLSKETQ